MSSSPFRLRVATPFAAGLASLLLALCAGAVWSVLSVVTGTHAAWMVVPTIFVARFAVSHTPFRAPALRAVIAALLVGLGTSYALYLQAATLITSQLGVPFGESIRTVGATLAWMIMSSRIEPLAWYVLMVSPAVAALVEFVEARKPGNT